jgi:electron transport complex protein RnfA
MHDYVYLMVGAALVNNVILARFLGLCSFMGVTTRLDTAIGMGLATTFVITVSSVLNWGVQEYLLTPFGLGYLRTVIFILVIAAAVQFTEMTVRKVSPPLFQLLGIYLPLITTNCAILGLAIFQTNRGYGFLEGLFFAIGGGVGLTLALVLMASIRETLELADVPTFARNMGLVLILAGALSLAFMGFAGLFSAA